MEWTGDVWKADNNIAQIVLVNNITRKLQRGRPNQLETTQEKHGRFETELV